MVCYTAYTALHFYLRVFSTTQQLAYVRQRELSVIYGLVLFSYAYTSLTSLHTSILVRYFYFYILCSIYLVLIRLAVYRHCREIYAVIDGCS